MKSNATLAAAPTLSSAKNRRNWIVFGAAAIAALAIGLGSSLWFERERIIAETEKSAAKLALALDAHSRATFESADTVLRITQGQLERAGARGDATAETVRAVLAYNVAGQRIIHSLSLRDRDGRVTLLTLLPEAPMVDTSASDYFRAQRDGTANGTYIGRPIHSIVTGEWMIPLSRRLTDERGEFSGVLVAAIPLRFFGDFFLSLQVGDHGLVTLLRADGVTLVREPVDDRIGERMPGSSPLFNTYLPQSPIGTLRLLSSSDGIDRIFAYRQVANLPLVVTVGIAVDDALSGWYAELRQYIAVWLGCATLLAAFTLIMVRHANRRETTERLAREVEDRFRRVVANIPGGVFQRVHEPDGTFTYNFLSANAKQIFGYPAEAIIRTPSLMLDLIHEDDRPALDRAIRESAERMATLTMEYRIRRPDGEVRWIQTNSTPRRLLNGDVVSDGLIIDVTERKQMELALQKSEADAARARALLTDAIESINGGFVIYDAEDRLVLMNRTAREWNPDFAAVALPGATHEELIRAAAKTGRLVGTGPDIDAIVQQRLQLHRNAYGQPIERCVGGRWFQVTEYPTSDGGVVVLRTDITELKQANLRLEEARLIADQASRAKSEFLAMMSHELRTPLNAVLGFSEIIRDHVDTLPSAKVAEYAADVYSSGTHLLTLINDVLDLSKMEAGRMELNRQPIEVDEIVDRSLRMVKDRAMRHSIDIIKEVAPHLPPLWADERKLIQILLNLLSNAVKFTPDGGRVVISAHHDRNSVILRVADNGIGIAADDIAKALSPFGQIDSLLTRQHAGTGLGLPLAKNLAELHGASFELESALGLGTTVTLRFPLGLRAAA